MTCSRVILSLCSRWIAEVARKTWIRGVWAKSERLPGAVDVAVVAAGQAADGRAGDLGGDGADGLEVALRGDREAGLDDVDAQRREGAGDLELLGHVHARAGRLLAVAQGRVEDPDAGAVRVGCGGRAPGGAGGGRLRVGARVAHGRFTFVKSRAKRVEGRSREHDPSRPAARRHRKSTEAPRPPAVRAGSRGFVALVPLASGGRGRRRRRTLRPLPAGKAGGRQGKSKDGRGPSHVGKAPVTGHRDTGIAVGLIISQASTSGQRQATRGSRPVQPASRGSTRGNREPRSDRRAASRFGIPTPDPGRSSLTPPP